MPVFVGTSGWQYASWKGNFYPAEVRKDHWLEEYAVRFSTVEVNNAFYRLPERSVFESWKERTPGDFVVAVKASRYLTHIKRLRDPREPVHRLMDRAELLGDKLGPVLLQLPPTLSVDLDALDETLKCFPAGVRVAVELRHPSWFVDSTAEVLQEHGAAYCLVDSPHLRTPEWRTADWGYVRFHEGRATPRPSYGRGALQRWATRLESMFGDGPDVYAYFNNDTGGCAPRNAATFVQLLRSIGLKAPTPEEP